jgi:hypothetical protein
MCAGLRQIQAMSMKRPTPKGSLFVTGISLVYMIEKITRHPTRTSHIYLRDLQMRNIWEPELFFTEPVTQSELNIIRIGTEISLDKSGVTIPSNMKGNRKTIEW